MQTTIIKCQCLYFNYLQNDKDEYLSLTAVSSIAKVFLEHTLDDVKSNQSMIKKENIL